MINGTVTGRLDRDDELREHNGKPVLNMSIALRVGKDQTIWVSASFWGVRAEKIAPMLTKGAAVAVVGAMDLLERDGKTYLRCDARDVDILATAPAQDTKGAYAQ
ncbi:single-stranded DNA-binding protein [Ruegeria sp. HKCCD7221]|uniref:single-stranded DNA-binding protein n=1 Tax=Ruegeria sp. HKCCD7221 TaxID=2683009 RepID=UPI0014897368|nr:single-stranded DNA-binding protein [Ruegeria sp. HKCCD7221]